MVRKQTLRIDETQTFWLRIELQLDQATESGESTLWLWSNLHILTLPQLRQSKLRQLPRQITSHRAQQMSIVTNVRPRYSGILKLNNYANPPQR